MFGEDVSISVSYPAINKLFEVREDTQQLRKNKGELFQQILAKLLFIMKELGPDLNMTVSFLMNRVSKSDLDDWESLEIY